MQHIKNTEHHYGLISIFFHWIMAALIIALLALGLYMVWLPDVGFNTWKVILIFVHKELGVVVLALVIIRLLWRLGNVSPQLPSQLSPWQKFSARVVHWAFYGFMFALPITGWLMSSAAGIPMTFLGLFELPDLISPNIYQMQLLIEIHKWLAYGLICSIFVHISAALVHQFIYKDDTLRGMLP
ncbi:MAG: cytochrome b [Alphaproteobacteria bacterium]|nr:cytochrome b [Alphaproteobacteria bacterium]